MGDSHDPRRLCSKDPLAVHHLVLRDLERGGDAPTAVDHLEDTEHGGALPRDVRHLPVHPDRLRRRWVLHPQPGVEVHHAGQCAGFGGPDRLGAAPSWCALRAVSPIVYRIDILRRGEGSVRFFVFYTIFEQYVLPLLTENMFHLQDLSRWFEYPYHGELMHP